MNKPKHVLLFIDQVPGIFFVFFLLKFKITRTNQKMLHLKYENQSKNVAWQHTVDSNRSRSIPTGSPTPKSTPADPVLTWLRPSSSVYCLHILIPIFKLHFIEQYNLQYKTIQNGVSSDHIGAMYSSSPYGHKKHHCRLYYL